MFACPISNVCRVNKIYLTNLFVLSTTLQLAYKYIPFCKTRAHGKGNTTGWFKDGNALYKLNEILQNIIHFHAYETFRWHMHAWINIACGF